MLRHRHFRLLTLGRLTLIRDSGEEEASLAKQRRKLALLVVLAMARRPMSRDTLVEMFWGDQDEARARHSLSNALSSLRRVLGPNAISTRDADVEITSESRLAVDALELVESVEQREFARAVDIYEGPFLDGIYVDASPNFDQWVTRERRRLEGIFIQACTQRCATLARSRQWPECHSLARRWLDAQPLSPDAALFLLNATKAPGTRLALAAAHDEYETLKRHLSDDFGLPPEPAVRSLAESIREQLSTVAAEPVTEAMSLAVVAPAAPVVPRVSAGVRVSSGVRPSTGTAVHRSARSRWRPNFRRVGALVVLAVALVLSLDRGRSDPDGIARRPLVAVMGVSMRADDSALAWLSEGLPQMISGKLARTSGVDVVPATQVQGILARSGHSFSRSGIMDDGDVRDLAKRVGATIEAHGAIARDGEKLILELIIHDVASGRLLANAVLSRDNPLALADEAAARILGAANVSGSGPQLTGVETRSLEAYQHYISALDAGQAGRYIETKRELDAAIALDSGFLAAVRSRISAAIGDDDTALTRQLRASVKRFADRATEFERLDDAAEQAFYAGERERSEALARALVQRFPRDPRSYHRLALALAYHGEFAEYEQVGIRLLALDSAALGAGSGPCQACQTYANIVFSRWFRADYVGAADWALQWIRVQPDGAAAWAARAWSYSYIQKPDSALNLMQRAIDLAGDETWAKVEFIRMLIISRQYEAADSAVRVLSRSARSVDDKETVVDLRSVLARERGRFQESTRLVRELAATLHQAAGYAEMVESGDLRAEGQFAEAARRYERIAHQGETRPVSLPLPTPAARGFCWLHALAADAYAPTGDTVALRVMADTLERGCTRSFYARDWRLYHHARGLLAARSGRYAEAEREFSQAVWSPTEGWSRTTVELADAQLRLGRPRDAIATLRTAYATRLDAMGRYVPISEVDYRMAVAFAQMGQADSARIYSRYVRAAWAKSDPGIRKKLAALPD